MKFQTHSSRGSTQGDLNIPGCQAISLDHMTTQRRQKHQLHCQLVLLLSLLLLSSILAITLAEERMEQNVELMTQVSSVGQNEVAASVEFANNDVELAAARLLEKNRTMSSGREKGVNRPEVAVWNPRCGSCIAL